MADHTQFCLSLFAGAAGLDLAVRIAVPNSRCVGYVEIDVSSARILASRMEDGSLDPAPVWSDAGTLPCELYRGRVAGLLAGFPCPDYSLAGRRRGIVGKHGQQWQHVVRAIREIRPDWCFLENVPGIAIPHPVPRWRWDRERRRWTQYVLPAGLWFVLGDLAALGFDAEWRSERASDVGAPHKRERIFILAYRRGRRLDINCEPHGRAEWGASITTERR